MNLKELSASEFNDFVNEYKNSNIYQTEQYANAMNNQKFTHYYYGLEDDNKIYVATLILVEKSHGFKYAYAPRGYLMDYTDNDYLKTFTALLKKELGKKGIIAIKLNPEIIKETYDSKSANINSNSDYEMIFNNLKKLGYYHLGYNNFFEAFKPRFEARLKLNIPLEQLFNNIDDKAKEYIINGDNAGLQVFKCNGLNKEYLSFNNKMEQKEIDFYQNMANAYLDNLEMFYIKLDTNAYLKNVQRKYQEQSERSNVANAKVFETRGTDNTNEINIKLQEESKLNDIKNELVYATNLLKNIPNGIVIGSCIAIKHKNMVYLLTDNYDEQYKIHNANYVLLWKLIEKYKNDGIEEFNLGGITNFSLEDNPYKDLNEFKLGLGSVGYEYIGDLEFITNKPLYVMYQNSSPIRNILKK